jgi:hypothetical protein
VEVRRLGHNRLVAETAGAEGENLLDRVVNTVDDMVPSADPPEDAALVDGSRFVPIVGVLFIVCAVLLVPWVVVLATTLPERQLSPHYDLAWAGFDVMLCIALATTAWLVLRRSSWMGAGATWLAALLLTDAWFDVVTAPAGAERIQAVVLAAFVELPLAGVCLWLLVHAHEVARRRFRLLLRGRAGLRARGRP